jgi:hypothetical protein
MADQTTETEMVPTKTPLADVEAQQLSLAEEDAETKEKRRAERTLWTRIWQGTAIACVVLNLIAIGIETSAVCFISGIVAMVVSAAVYVFQKELQDTDCKYCIRLDRFAGQGVVHSCSCSFDIFRGARPLLQLSELSRMNYGNWSTTLQSSTMV